MSRVIIVSNRLPIKITKKDNALVYATSEGGLATGLGSVYKNGNNLWLGWPGLQIEKESKRKEVREQLSKENMAPVFLNKVEIKEFYEGFCNEALWPNFHYFNQHAVYKVSHWETYKSVNQKFCDEIIEILKPGDIVWVHDYQLLLLPAMIRRMRPYVSIGFFQHIPFPSFESFRLIPWRKELLQGILGSDFISFHTYDDTRHFLSSVNRLVGLSNNSGSIEMDSRTVEVDPLPMGIDYEKYANSAASPETLERELRYRSSLGDQKLILSIDRLDYSKGIQQRLRAFEMFLKKNPQYLEKVSLLMIVVPSRDKVPRYKELKEQIDELVGRINGTFGRISWTPVHYFYRSFPLSALSAFYRVADVAMITPMRDGMNLVCKEYIASKLDQKGVLILSEMAGASKELSDAILVNPNDIHQLVNAIKRAFEMPEEEQIRHMRIMQKTLKRYNIHQWVDLFLKRVKEVKERQSKRQTRSIDAAIVKTIKKSYNKAEKRMIFLDYDGTLTHFQDDPTVTSPDKELCKILKSLTSDSKNRIVIISGRDKDTLSKWLSEFKLDIIAEHGIWLIEHGQEPFMIANLENSWKKRLEGVMEEYVNRTPGSFVEEKDYSLVWHYRKVEAGLGELRTRELTSQLKHLTANESLQVKEGNKVIELKSSEVNKGKAAIKWHKKFGADFVIAIGDDWTDEDTFEALPDTAYTIKVGGNISKAKYNLEDVESVRTFLKYLCK